jgi:hypothetical protein
LRKKEGQSLIEKLSGKKAMILYEMGEYMYVHIIIWSQNSNLYKLCLGKKNAAGIIGEVQVRRKQ